MAFWLPHLQAPKGLRIQLNRCRLLQLHTNTCHQYLDSDLSVSWVAFDQSKAFDSLPCPTILSNLFLVGSLLNWFQNCLSNRGQKVVLNGYESFTAHVTSCSGVPHSSIWPPTYYHFHLLVYLYQKALGYLLCILLYKPIISHDDAIAFQSDINIVSNCMAF